MVYGWLQRQGGGSPRYRNVFDEVHRQLSGTPPLWDCTLFQHHEGNKTQLGRLSSQFCSKLGRPQGNYKASVGEKSQFTHLNNQWQVRL